MRHPPVPPPTADVLAAFGTSGAPVLLAGGENRSYRCGELVLKVVDDDDAAEALLELESRIEDTAAFRFPRPVRSAAGRWVHAGWCARPFVVGSHHEGRDTEELAVCRAFHAAIAGLPRPAFLDAGEPDPWEIADEVTWGERDWQPHPRVAPVVAQLRAVLQPVRASSQLIHGDFGGNLLFAEGVPPAVIDFSPYWRPAGFALGVVVADALVWGGAPASLIDAVSDVDEWLQLLARAALRRVLEIDTLSRRGRHMLDEIDAHRPAVAAICRRIS